MDQLVAPDSSTMHDIVETLQLELRRVRAEAEQLRDLLNLSMQTNNALLKALRLQDKLENKGPASQRGGQGHVRFDLT